MNKGISLIKKYEGCKLKSYLCPAKIPTIGWGNTMYENGAKVKLGDEITQQRADELLLHVVGYFEKEIQKLVTCKLSDNQFGALTSFAYNVGLGHLVSGKYVNGFGGSTLLKKVNINPNDPTIKDEFLKWNKAGGQVLAGLTKRRQEEATLYFA
jgi:lysozyme